MPTVIKQKETIVRYHGTNEAAARKILQEGFLPDSWFAKNVGDAVAFGGRYVFVVQFGDDVPFDWQFHCLSAVPKTRILNCYVIESAEL